MDQPIVAERMKCPICYEVPKCEIFQCLDGHIICNECCSKVTQCPQCRKSFIVADGKVRNRVLESLIEGMIFKCPHKDLGCEAKLKRVELSPHAKSCKYQHSNFQLCREIGYPNCEFVLSTSNIRAALQHFELHGIQICPGYSSTIRFSRVREFYDLFRAGKSRYPLENATYTPVVLIPSAEEQHACEQTLPAIIILTTIGSKGQWIGWLCVILEDPRSEMDAKSFEIEFVIKTRDGEGESIPDLQWKLTPVQPHQVKTFEEPPMRISTPLLEQYYMKRKSEALNVVVTVNRKTLVEEPTPTSTVVETGLLTRSTMEAEHVSPIRGRGRASHRITIRPSGSAQILTGFRGQDNSVLQQRNSPQTISEETVEVIDLTFSPPDLSATRGRGEGRRPRGRGPTNDFVNMWEQIFNS